MTEEESPKSSKNPILRSVDSATAAMRSLFRLERQRSQDATFQKGVEMLQSHETALAEALESEVQELYYRWASRYERIREEFNRVAELFQELEPTLPGWYYVSPNLAPWRSVGLVKGGYTLAACLMKNHSRNAPLSEKSLSVSFGLDELPSGIGDERALGRPGEIDDVLAGLAACTGRSRKQQLETLQLMVNAIESKSIVFRMNHKIVGQQTTRLPISVLDEYSLRELCQGLFLLLNNDVLSELQRGLQDPGRLLIAAASAQLTAVAG